MEEEAWHFSAVGICLGGPQPIKKSRGNIWEIYPEIEDELKEMSLDFNLVVMYGHSNDRPLSNMHVKLDEDGLSDNERVWKSICNFTRSLDWR